MTLKPFPLSAEAVALLRAYLTTHWQAPEQYIVSLFKTRDVVLLAEDHAIRHNLHLAHALVPLLYQAGVHNLGMEFGASEDQAALDHLVTAERYDENIARRLMFNYNVGWAFQEYLDVYRAAWTFNRTLPSGARRFRILNLSYQYQWAEAPVVRTPENARTIYPRGPIDAYRAERTWREVLDRGEKILILTGTPHAFTRYRIPLYDFNAESFVRFEDRNLGQRLYQQAPDRVACVMLHQAFPSQWQGSAELVFPAQGAIDQVLDVFVDKRVGFDLSGTPFGELLEASYYATGYDDFRLSHLADGYVYERPFAEYEGCTLDEAFVNETNWPEVQRQYPDPDWHPRPETMAEYWAQVRAYANIPYRYRTVR
jgi:hypothetical protein